MTYSPPPTPPAVPRYNESSFDPPVPTGPIPLLQFRFDGGALTWLGVGIGGFLVTALSLGILLPWAIVMQYRWQAKHTIVNGYRLRFTGDAFSLFGQWIKWLLLIIITIGIYLFWVYPRLTKWIVEHQEVDPRQAR